MKLRPGFSLWHPFDKPSGLPFCCLRLIAESIRELLPEYRNPIVTLGSRTRPDVADPSPLDVPVYEGCERTEVRPGDITDHIVESLSDSLPEFLLATPFPRYFLLTVPCVLGQFAL